MLRKLVIVALAILVPGGLIALFVAWLAKRWMSRRPSTTPVS